MSRKINCMKCGKYLGEIRDATLAKNIMHCCADCSAKLIVNNIENGFSEIRSMLDGFAKRRKS